MAGIRRINAPITNPLTLDNLRQATRRNKQILLPIPGSNEALDIGQQLGATLADPLGIRAFSTQIDGYGNDIKNSIPGAILGGVILVIGLVLIWAGVQAFVLPAAGKVAAAAAGAVA